MIGRVCRGFTLVELLMVIGIIAVLATVVFVSLNLPGRFEDAKINQATSVASTLKAATQLYFNDMGFYPPDVNRGADPGFTQSMPHFPDGYEGSLGIKDDHLPSNWEDLVAQNWRGPYLAEWPDNTPWGGEYDYNYWGTGTTRYGCEVPAGVYSGIQGDYGNNNTIPFSAEQKMVDLGYDADGCVNGETQLLLIKF